MAEVLEVTTGTLTEMQRHQEEIQRAAITNLSRNYREQAKEYLSFQISLLKGLKLRSDSNQKRLKNEVDLVSGLIPHNRF
jgi:hypothetical protein